MYQIKQNTMYDKTVNIVLKTNADGTITTFGEYPDNTDYQAYLAWVADGNTPQPADEVTQ